MKKLKNNTKISTIALILILTISAILIALPTASAAMLDVEIETWVFAFDPIGVNQVQSIGCQLSEDVDLYKPVQEENLLYDAYYTLTKPDGTTVTIDGPFHMDKLYSHYLVLEYTPDQVGAWTVQFDWAGDGTYYSAASGSSSFTVQQEQVDIIRVVEPYIFVRPDPIGLGQSLLVVFGNTPRPILPGDVYKGYMVTLTKPDGTTDVIGPITSYPDSTNWLEYVVDQVGTWTIRMTWEGDKYEAPADTGEIPFTVQTDPIPTWPAAPDPTEPYDYPINVENREWASFTGQWLVNIGRVNADFTRSAANLYSKAPRAPHILWTKPAANGIGGQVGGIYSSGVYYDVEAMEFGAIIAGRAYWQGDDMIHAVDLHTGEELWAVEGQFSFGSIEVPDVGSAQPILVCIDESSARGRIIKYDAITGEKILDVPGFRGTRNTDRRVFDPLGGYVVDINQGLDNQYMIKYSFFGDTEFFADRIAWNITYPFEGPTNTNIIMALNVETNTISQLTYDIYGDSGAIDYQTGEVLWKRIVPEIQSRHSSGWGYGNIYHTLDKAMLRALDERTGEVLWDSEKMPWPWGTYWAYSHAFAYGQIFKLGYAGLYSIDPTDGSINWIFNSGDSQYETPYRTWPFYLEPVVADGIIFATTSEHSPTLPIYRGQHLFAVDAYEGTMIWQLMGTTEPQMIADGILIAQGEYDGVTYAIGKGETATTIAASPKVTTHGSSILIEGTVLDQSPAQQGTAAISDASMDVWMEYLHMQQPIPRDAEGVSISLDTIDPNGNYIHIGTVTNDLSGSYSYLWTPEHEGKYTIIATFEGSESYYSSYAETAIGVEPAASAATPMEPEPTEPTAEAPMITTELAIIAAIAVIAAIGIVAFWALRKRK